MKEQKRITHYRTSRYNIHACNDVQKDYKPNYVCCSTDWNKVNCKNCLETKVKEADLAYSPFI